MSNMIFLSDMVTYNALQCCLERVSEDMSVHLTPNEKKLLELILAQRGQKETIIEEIWGSHGVIVTSSSYHQLVKMLRSKFQKIGLSPDMLQTIPRYGVVLNINLATDESETKLSKSMSPAYQNQIIRSFSCTLAAANYDDFTKENIFSLRTIYSCVLIFILIGVLFFQLLQFTNKNDLFDYHQRLGNVQFYATSSLLFNKSVISRVSSQKNKDDSKIYITKNGPKILVLYCNGDISKDSTLCRSDSFSSY